MNLPSDAEKIINIISENGGTAFAVGGYVRDMMMNRIAGDIDITTSLIPKTVEEILTKNNIKVIETGIKHGTVTAVLNKIPYEITTFRFDGDYNDNRHPNEVFFTENIKDDLSRRDFTINAMAYNHSVGLVDEFGGKEDINKKIIRAVGNADKRFKEDALRIMRAIRFSSVLSFEIEEKTKKAIFDNKELLKNISAERIFAELQKTLVGENVLNVLDEYKEVFAVIIPELKPAFNCEQNTPWHIYNVYDHIIHSVSFASFDKTLRLTMLLHDIGKPAMKTTDEKGIDHFKFHAKKSAEMAEMILRRFKTSNELREKVVLLIENHQRVEKVDDINVKRWMNKIGEDNFDDLLAVRLADLKAHNREKTAYEEKIITEKQKEIKRVIEAKEVYQISGLKINGNDLISLGFKGNQIGEELNKILDLVMDGKIKNEKQEIIEFINKDIF